ncbi:MAG: hypothetical protein HY010_09515 [Acidobacteria bacterium]|nr:hypothetical protein [Acidobacteriota bacterium]
MNCADLQQALPETIDGSGNPEYQAHLKSCPDCSELVSELELIASESRQLTEADEPPQRVWVKIAAELRAEGIIREAEVAPARPVLVPSARRRWNAWWLVPVAAAIVAAGSYSLKPKPAGPVAVQTPPAVSVQNSAQAKTSASSTVATEKRATPAVTAKTTNAARPGAPDDHAPLMLASDQQLLSAVPPEMRSAYETQLAAVNSYIQDAQKYLKQNPDDEDARQHLMEANEQREMLYQMALDHVQ